MKIIPLDTAFLADSKTLSRFFVSLTVFELLDFEIWLSGGPKISRHDQCDVTVADRILKFGMVIELNKANILCNYAKSLALISWVPDGKN